MIKKYLILFFSIFSIFATYLKADFPMNELLIYNYSTENLYIRFYPISGLFNSSLNQSITKTEYSNFSQLYDPTEPLSGANRKGGGYPLKTIVGLDGVALDNSNPTYDGYFKISTNQTCEFSVDFSSSLQQDGLIGFGTYKLEIYKDVSETLVPICDPIIIDWLDFNYISTTYSGDADLLIYIRGLSESNIKYLWDGSGGTGEEEIAVFGNSPYPCPSPGLIQVYKQYYKYINNEWTGYNVPTITHPRSLGSSTTNQYSLVYPVDGRDLPFPYSIPQHTYAGKLDGNLIIDSNVTTRDTLIQNPTNILIPKYGYLKINSGKIFNMVPASSPSGWWNNLVVQDSSLLLLFSNSKLIVNDNNLVTLNRYGKIRINTGAELKIEQGGLFCNEGGKILGGIVTYGKGHHIPCAVADYLFEDSAKLILEDSAIVEIPDSVTLNFTGNETALIMKPYSKLKMGSGSKIIIGSNAKLIADSAEFSSIDSTKTWEGIVMGNSSHDTIKNCTFKNAKTALSFINAEGASYYRRIIQNNIFQCSFRRRL